PEVGRAVAAHVRLAASQPGTPCTDTVDGTQNSSLSTSGKTRASPNWSWSKTSFQMGVGWVGKQVKLRSFGPCGAETTPATILVVGTHSRFATPILSGTYLGAPRPA